MNRSSDKNDPSLEALDEIRKQFLAIDRNTSGKRKSRRRKTWVTEWTPDLPKEWTPYAVNNPTTGQPFTEESARRFVIELLETSHASLEEVVLDKPPGAKAYVLLIEIEADKPPLYIKIQLGAGCIIGRSFHYSRH